MKSLEHRLTALEHRCGRSEIDAMIDRCLEDPAFLVAAVKSAPGRPGTEEAALDAEILAMEASHESA